MFGNSEFGLGRSEVAHVEVINKPETLFDPPYDQLLTYILAILNSVKGVQSEQMAQIMEIFNQLNQIQQAIDPETLKQIYFDEDKYDESVIAKLYALNTELKLLQIQVQQDRKDSDQHDLELEKKETGDYNTLTKAIDDLGIVISKMADSQALQSKTTSEIQEKAIADGKRSDSRDMLFLGANTFIGILGGTLAGVMANYIYNAINPPKEGAENPNKDSKDKNQAIRERIVSLRQIILDLDISKLIDINNVNEINLGNLDMGLEHVVKNHDDQKKSRFKETIESDDEELKRFSKLYDTQLRGLLIQTRLEMTLNKMEALVSPESFTKKNVDTLNEELKEQFILKSRSILVNNKIFNYNIILYDFEIYLSMMTEEVLKYPAFFQPKNFLKSSDGASSMGYYLLPDGRLSVDAKATLASQAKESPQIPKTIPLKEKLIDQGVTLEMVKQEMTEAREIAAQTHLREVYVTAGESSASYNDLFRDDNKDNAQKQNIVSEITVTFFRLYRKINRLFLATNKAGFESQHKEITEVYNNLQNHQLTVFIEQILDYYKKDQQHTQKHDNIDKNRILKALVTKHGTDLNSAEYLMNKGVTFEKEIKSAIMNLSYNDLIEIINRVGRPVGRADGFAEMVFGRPREEVEAMPNVIISENIQRGPLTSGLPEVFDYIEPSPLINIKKSEADHTDNASEGALKLIRIKNEIAKDIVLANKIEKGLANFENDFSSEHLNTLLIDYFWFADNFLSGEYKRSEYVNESEKQTVGKYSPGTFVSIFSGILEKVNTPRTNKILEILPYIFLTDFDIIQNRRPRPFFIDYLRENNLKMSSNDYENLVTTCNHLTYLLYGSDQFLYSHPFGVMSALSRFSEIKLSCRSIIDPNRTQDLLTAEFLTEINPKRVSNESTGDPWVMFRQRRKNKTVSI